MNKILIIIFALTFLITGCGKTGTECTSPDSGLSASAAERTDVRNYLNANGITATEHASGFFYAVVNPGSTTSIANLCTAVAVKYTGKLTSGVVFDSTPAGQVTTFTLAQVIVGWQKGLPLIQKGGTINLYIPPGLGYGSNAVKDQNGNVIIPANSILIFQIELVDVGN